MFSGDHFVPCEKRVVNLYDSTETPSLALLKQKVIAKLQY